MPDPTILVDGQLGWGGGINSISVTTMATPQTPDGLKRDQLAWLNNGTVRDGGISPRPAYHWIGQIHLGNALYQGGYVYEPSAASPYLMLSIGGHIYAVDPNSGSALDLSAAFNLFNPSDVEQAYMVQGEEFLVIQAGDGVTLPLFWDGVTLRRSKGITNTAVAPGTPGINELPAATAMDYYMGRIWYAQGRQYSAGDIVGGNSGTIAYKRRDSILNVTENPLVLGGDGFTVPDNAGNIRALKHNANLDAALGQGQLFIFTRKAVYALKVPVSRADWIAADNDHQPLQTVVQLVNGAVNDRSVVAANGDLFYQSLEPGIRSLIAAIRYFTQWGNVQISANENRILQFNDRALLHMASGIVFDNRLLQTALPKRAAQGVIHQAVIPMDFTPISSFGAGASPVWEGMHEGLDILQLFTASFAGLERGFAVTVSRVNSTINLWEIVPVGRFDRTPAGEDTRISMQVEFPAYTWNQAFLLKRMVSGEIWYDRLYGTVDFLLEWRPDGDACWKFWHKWQGCSAKNCTEDVNNPCGYPIVPYGDSYRATETFPIPPEQCATVMRRPANLGFQMQARLTVKGYCRVRGFLLKAYQIEKELYKGLTC